jgi:hypothetical protein
LSCWGWRMMRDEGGFQSKQHETFFLELFCLMVG